MIEKIKNQSEYKEALELIYKETREDLLKLKKEGVIPEWNDDSKESKEWPIDVEKMPFRIDSSTREETKIFMMEKGRKIDVLIKINPEWDICEYIGFPKKYDSKWKEIVEEFPYAGEQLKCDIWDSQMVRGCHFGKLNIVKITFFRIFDSLFVVCLQKQMNNIFYSLNV